ncbi:MAG: Cell division protein FtsA [Bacteroidota bacterium]|nr:Cell division protein FtsA [Bacteroidota bacterium]
MPETNASDKEVSCAGAEIVVGLDIGTAKVCALVAAPEDDGETLKILGIGITESEGLNRGVVTNIERTVNTLQKVVQQGEQQSGLKITEVIVGIAGDHIESFQSHGLIGISSTTKEIARADVDRLLQDTSNISIPSGRKIIHLIPQDYIIDGQDGITDPVGMSGVRMEANFHVVTGLVSAIENIHKCVERLGIKVRDIVLEPIASSHAVLTEEEKEVGVALIDIGGGTTDLAIFENHIIRFTSVFGIGGRQVTNDIREILGIIAHKPKKLKSNMDMHALILY